MLASHTQKEKRREEIRIKIMRIQILPETWLLFRDSKSQVTFTAFILMKTVLVHVGTLVRRRSIWLLRLENVLLETNWRESDFDYY